MKKKVAIAMSGGVDSSVAALLLKEQGYETIGITLKILPCAEEERDNHLKRLRPVFNPEVSDRREGLSPKGNHLKRRNNLCCALRDIDDARKVCASIGIPHYVLDFTKEFEKEVIKYFCSEYLKGNTPNPCIVCNTKIRFGSLLEKIKKMGIDYLATGHYARIEKNEARGTRHEARFLLKKGIDEKKDQSYVLYGLTQEKMKDILFPLGNYRKEEVRKLAKKNNLPVAEKAESQEICFIEDADYRKFLQTRIAADPPAPTLRWAGKNTDEHRFFEPGPIVDLQRKVLGEHQGLAFYTIGQRKGLRIAQGKPLYVVDIDVKNNTLVVGVEKDAYGKKLEVKEVNWLIEGLTFPLDMEAKIRYKHPSAKAKILPSENGNFSVEFSQLQWAITPGQSVVFYQDDIVLGGGIISRRC